MAEKYSCVFRIKKATNKKAPISIGALNVVAGAGFEPTTFGL
tara:strand:- start:169 stop:294 length:126 start_codon:yes stop_codon:yes gene_type:complete